MSLHPRRDLVVPLETEDRQRRAADPGAFAWVSANAGAGKTKVLTDRVIRLLLAGSPPGRVLCLTFTRAAAAEMTTRVFEQLGRWVTLDADALAAALFRLEGRHPSPRQVRQARQLFARAVETPGGLKIDTIHAFCERLLHLVPFEAGVPPRFAVLDESEAGEVMAEARSSVMAEAAGAGASEALASALAIASLQPVDRMVAAIDCAVRDARIPSEPDERAAALWRLRQALGAPPGESEDSVEREMLEDGLSRSDWLRLADRLAGSGKVSDGDQAERLRSAAAARDPAAALAFYREVFFGGDGPRDRLVTKAVASEEAEALVREQARLQVLEEKLQAVRTLERTEALYTLAGEVRARYRDGKARRGALDFDDLIHRTLGVLTTDAAAWVLYKLDRGVDHILIDEAQDTNPEQWEILRRISEDFTAGEGAAGGRVRTLFAVGDPKQSIYAFQGADPRWFEDGRRYWMRRTREASIGFHDVRLDLSFRSTGAVLRAVDATFRIGSHFAGLSYADEVIGTVHRSARPAIPGQVEIWPIEPRAAGERDPDAWSQPLDEPERTSPAVVSAGRVAAAIRAWTRSGDETGRVWNPRDILVLVRKRGPAFFAVIRALRLAGVPVAGADRFDIGEHIAVLDLVAAASAALLPQDDLTLAAALKSPLAGLDDDDLLRIAAGRGESEPLADALRRCAAAGDAAARRGADALDAWRALARDNGPFGFYAALLGPMEGRRRLVARLGHEAADAVDAFLCHAQAAETRGEAPSLTAFLARFGSASHTIKRDLDASGDEVRVMTVHGAKGLEAPLVVILDGCDVGGEEPILLPVTVAGAEAVPAWSLGRKHDCRAMGEARQSAGARTIEEHNRLLYVAMTRARDRLVIAPFAGGRGAPPEQSWCRMVRRGLDDSGWRPVPLEATYGLVDVWRDDAPSEVRPEAVGNPAEPDGERPPWLDAPIAAPPPAVSALSPSAAVAAAPSARHRQAGDAAAARLRGTLTHLLVERLAGVPAERRRDAGMALMLSRAPGSDAGLRDQVLAEAEALLAAPILAPLFAPGSCAEVAIAGSVGVGPDRQPRQVFGRVDRLAVLRDEVLLADFKTGAPPASSAPEAYVTQLALYAALLAGLYPEKTVRAFLVWSSGPVIRELEAAAMAAALDAIPPCAAQAPAA
jgi:ATP-dependent helicase/nuclease subunit A